MKTVASSLQVAHVGHFAIRNKEFDATGLMRNLGIHLHGMAIITTSLLPFLVDDHSLVYEGRLLLIVLLHQDVDTTSAAQFVCGVVESLLVN